MQNTFRVGKFTVVMTLVGRDIKCVWDPRMPGRKLTAEENAQYVSGRDTFLLELSSDTNAKVFVIDANIKP